MPTRTREAAVLNAKDRARHLDAVPTTTAKKRRLRGPRNGLTAEGADGRKCCAGHRQALRDRSPSRPLFFFRYCFSSPVWSSSRCARDRRAPGAAPEFRGR